MESKHPIDSKTLHLNILIVAAMPFLPVDKRNDPEFLQSMIAVAAIFNVICRFFTHGKLDFDAE